MAIAKDIGIDLGTASVLVYVKGIIKEISEQVHPRRVKVLRVDGKRVDDSILRAIYISCPVYAYICHITCYRGN